MAREVENVIELLVTVAVVLVLLWAIVQIVKTIT
jgi:hypothetical protein